MHPLLERQVQKFFGSAGAPDALAGFLAAVSDAYDGCDEDRRLLERSLDFSSEELVQANAEMLAVLQAFPDVFLWLDEKGHLLNSRSTLQGRYGWFAEAARRGERIQDIPVPLAAAAFAAALAEVHQTQKLVAFEFEYVQEGRTERHEARILPLEKGRMLAILRDITERHQLEQRLRQAQKMEAVGRLAGGVAHDFNNLLTAIVGYDQLLLNLLPDGSEPRAFSLEILQAANRAASLVRQLLAYGRQQVLQPRVLNLNDVLLELAGMLQGLMGPVIAVRVEPSPRSPHVFADRSQLEEVLMNLALNAHDAMPDGGRLHIRVSTRELAAGTISGEGPAGAYALLTVEDTGRGMDEATRQRIFEPFFTTKDVGAGRGLGLATVQGIVEQSGGYILVDSEVGQGTRFLIGLPLRTEPDQRTGPAPSSAPARGAETVLVVEDDDLVRAMVASTLAEHGYRVLQAQNGREAVSFADGFEGPIDLLLTDVVMPVADGREAAAGLLRRRPGLRVLFMSVHPAEEASGRAVDPGEIDFLSKPFQGDTLLHRVREVLDRPRGEDERAA